ncbi:MULTISPECIES: CAP-associated domain-containing protein [Vagococcus]|uniref:CAP-associated domain-containing protein n=1 Tax=Vagococcus TaxID=2737 RepID=UPI002FCB0AF6
MKRFFEFTVCLIIVFSIVYMKPVISSRNQPKPKNDLLVEEVKVSHKSVPYYELNTTGMANHIGKTEKEFLKEFPNPKKTWDSYNGSKWLVYGETVEDTYQVEIRNHVVTSIFVLGEKVDSSPFSMGMNLVDLAEITTIFSNFNFEYGDEKYEVELTEDDMNYRPLVAFNNGTFAMLHINQGNGQLMAVRYLDKNSLLALMPYQMNQENKVKQGLQTPPETWGKVNQDNREQLIAILNLLREKEEKEKYVLDSKLQVGATESLQTLIEKPEDILEDEARLKSWQEMVDKEDISSTFLLNEKELKKLATKVDLKEKETHGIFYYPVTDVPFMVTNWYGSRFYHEELAHKTDRLIGISFNEEMVMTFLGPENEASQTTESSDNN